MATFEGGIEKEKKSTRNLKRDKGRAKLNDRTHIL